MSSFVYDNTNIPEGKSDNAPLSVPPNKGITAAEWNTTTQAIKDLRTAFLVVASPQCVIATSNISGTNTGNVTLNPVGSTPAAAGASLSGQALTLQPADATHGGVIAPTDQDWGNFSKVFYGSVPVRRADLLGIKPSNTANQNRVAWNT